MQPVHRVPKAQQRKRRSHLALKPTLPVVCPNCGNPRQPHAACTQCGYVRPGLTLKLSNKED